MTTTYSDGILTFPDPANQGDIHIHSGIEYTRDKGRWVVIPPDPLSLVADVYVKVDGDTMTGSLECPMFRGNYDLESLKGLNELP